MTNFALNIHRHISVTSPRGRNRRKENIHERQNGSRRKLNATIIRIATVAVICASGASAETGNTAPPLDRISVFKVDLICPAAPAIGCGSRAKPILLELEKQNYVAEAW